MFDEMYTWMHCPVGITSSNQQDLAMAVRNWWWRMRWCQRCNDSLLICQCSLCLLLLAHVLNPTWPISSAFSAVCCYMLVRPTVTTKLPNLIAVLSVLGWYRNVALCCRKH